MLVNQTTKQFFLDADAKDFPLDIWEIISVLAHYHTNLGGHINYKWKNRKLMITVINPSPAAWEAIMKEVGKWGTLKRRVYAAQKEKEQKKNEEEKPKKKGFDWPFGKR